VTFQRLSEPHGILSNKIETINLKHKNIAMSGYILMLQTDTDDQLITEEALAELVPYAQVKFLPDLSGWSAFVTQHGKPLIILVNEEPAYGAIEVIKYIKTQSLYDHIPCIVLTEKLAQDDIIKYYKAGANTVISKPSSVELTNKKIQTFFSYWLTVAELPHELSPNPIDSLPG
jgi:CheY-like chemotaxis protein